MNDMGQPRSGPPAGDRASEWADDPEGLNPDDLVDTDLADGDAEPGPARSGKRLRRRRKSLSMVLTEIAQDETLDRVSIGDLLRIMHGRAIGALLLIFAFPNILPSLPGTSGVLGLPLVYLTSQMMLGRLPWLPAFIADRSMARSDFGGLVTRVTPLLARAERLLRPRLPFLVSHGAERVLGGLCLLLAVIIMLPIPFGNMLPALAICLFALGVLERDGLWIIVGLLVSAVAMTVVAGVVYALAKAAWFVLINAFV